MNFLQRTVEDIYQLTVDGDKVGLIQLIKANPGVSVDYQNNDGKTALMIASRTGNVDIVRVLLGAGADVNCVSRTVRSTALFDAASGGSTEVVRLLLTCDGIDVDLKDKAGNTALDVTKDDEIKSLLRQFYTKNLQGEASLNTRTSPADKLVTFKESYNQLTQQVAGAVPRADWLQRRDDLESRLRSAQAANEFADCVTLGRELQAHTDSASELSLSEADLLTLSARRDKLQNELQSFCHALVGSMDYDCLEEAAAALEAVRKLDPLALAAAEESAERASLAAAAAAADAGAGSNKESEDQVLLLQRTINELKNDLAQRDAKIDALSAELSKLRASPIAWIEDCPVDTYEAPRPKHRDSYIAEDFRWL